MRHGRPRLLRGLCLAPGMLLAVVVIACSPSDDAPPLTDGGVLDVAAESDSAGDAADGRAPPVCTVGRRRCTGMDLELCDEDGWILLQSCLAGESCDVAVGICRAVDGGSAASADADAGG